LALYSYANNRNVKKNVGYQNDVEFNEFQNIRSCKFTSFTLNFNLFIHIIFKRCLTADDSEVIFISGRHGARLQDHLQRRLDERKQRQRGRLASGSSKHCGLKMKGVNNRAGPSTVAMVTTKPVPSVFRPPPPVIPAAQSIIGML
jgi:hypothetical protein